MIRAASQAVDADSSRTPGLNSSVKMSMNFDSQTDETPVNQRLI